jgi:NAD(P)-dependent dehydrogenase (short-subunit alcohol dehydrogenase family)
MSGNTTVAGKSVLVTGANRGLGRTLVEEALRRGAKRVYAASRRPLVHADARVTPLILDVTNEAQIQEAVETVESLDILINNAGISLPDDLSDRGAVDQHLAVNLFGTWGVTEAFLPSLTRTGGAIVNVVSIGAFAAVPVLPAYSISKAAAFSLTQSLRALLPGLGVSVHAVMPGAIDTDMIRDLPIPKTPPESVARGIFDGMENDEEEIFPDPASELMAVSWRAGAAKELERQKRRAPSATAPRDIGKRRDRLQLRPLASLGSPPIDRLPSPQTLLRVHHDQKANERIKREEQR